MSLPKLVSLGRWRRELLLKLLPPALFLLLAAMMLLGERDPSGPQLLGVLIMAVLALSWTLPDLSRRMRVFSQVQAVQGELSEGLRLMEEGQHALAQAAFEALLAEHPELPAFQATALQNAAITCLRQGDFAGARQRFEAVIASGWGNHWRMRGGLGVVSLNGLAMLEALEGQLWEARQLQKKALARLPARGRSPFRLVDGLIHIREGKWEEGLKILEESEAGSVASGARMAVLQALRGYAATQQGGWTSPPSGVDWMGTAWPEMEKWLESGKKADTAMQQGA